MSAAAAGFDHGLLVQGGKVAVFGPAHRPPGTAPGLLLAPVPFKVAITHVAAGALLAGSAGSAAAVAVGRRMGTALAGPQLRSLAVALMRRAQIASAKHSKARARAPAASQPA